MNGASSPAAGRRIPWRTLAVLVAAGIAGVAWWSTRGSVPSAGAGTSAPVASAPRPALSVALVAPRREDWPRTLAAQGNIAAWQEAAVGAELSGFRVTTVLVNVGDRVRKGQTLATVNPETVAADVAQARAAVAEAEAVLAEARANAARSRDLAAKGFVSPQAATQTATLEQTAAARLAAARARLQAEEVRLSQTRVIAPDDGTISARTATVGSLAQPGQEMFRLIRGNRLEWRAEVTSGELARLAQGMRANVRLPTGAEVRGTVRTIAPTVDAQTRNAIVYVDLPVDDANPARAGMFARGEFELGRADAISLPQTAVVQRDGFSYAFLVGPDGRVAQTRIGVGRRVGDRVEVTEGLAADARVVASGAGFLSDGDLVRVVPGAPAATAAAGATAAAAAPPAAPGGAQAPTRAPAAQR
jgi:RND family efflux transporter MFP subunit